MRGSVAACWFFSRVQAEPLCGGRVMPSADGLTSIATTYDRNGNRLSLRTQDGRATSYGFDGLNRLTGTSSQAGSVQYRYDRSGRVLEQTWSNGARTSTRYNTAGRPQRIELNRGSTVINLTEYAYDTNGNRTEERINRPAGAQLTTYRYDRADRLIGTRRVEGANSVDTTWVYDGADNRLNETVVATQVRHLRHVSR
ncbi:MAG: hypothetical protein RLZZ618_1060 [Pseudomonadota bacterium]